MVSAASKRMDTIISAATKVYTDVDRRPVMPSGIFMLSATPVRSVASVRWAPDNTFNEAVTLSSTQWALPPDTPERVVIRAPYASGWYEVTYTGGWAYATERTVYAAAAAGGTPTPATYPQPDGRSFTLVAWDGANATFLPTIGTFMEGDVLTLGTVTLTLGAAVQESIANDYPEFELVVASQVAYWYKRHLTMGKTSTTLGGQTSWEGDYKVLDDNAAALAPVTRVFGFM